MLDLDSRIYNVEATVEDLDATNNNNNNNKDNNNISNYNNNENNNNPSNNNDCLPTSTHQPCHKGSLYREAIAEWLWHRALNRYLRDSNPMWSKFNLLGVMWTF